MYDIIIVGSGPAGLTAALYARRAEKSVLVIEKSGFGGQITHSPRVENYPGFVEVSGSELGEKLLDVDTTSDYNKKYFEMDVTEYVKAHMGETITFVLCNEGASSSNNHMDLGSREHAGQEPQLVIE